MNRRMGSAFLTAVVGIFAAAGCNRVLGNRKLSSSAWKLEQDPAGDPRRRLRHEHGGAAPVSADGSTQEADVWPKKTAPS